MSTEPPPGLDNIVVQNLFEENQRAWDVDILSNICNDRDKKLIRQIPIPMRPREDDWYWILEDKGEFSVRSCYRKIHGESECVNKSYWKNIWSLQLPGKVIDFIWRASRNLLPTAADLMRKQVSICATYSWCHNGIEDTGHILFQCSFAKEVWRLWDFRI